MLTIIAQIVFLAILLTLTSAVIIGAVAIIGSLAGLTVNFALIGLILWGLSVAIMLVYLLLLLDARRKAKALDGIAKEIFDGDLTKEETDK